MGALVGGAISGGLQSFAFRSAARERGAEKLEINQSLARSLMFKLTKVQSDFRNIAEHFEQMNEIATRRKMGFDWKTCLPLANLPREIEFTADEMSTLLGTKDNDLFNDVVALDHVHWGIIQNLASYREGREALESILPATMDGEIGTIELDDTLLRVAEPRATKLNSLLHQLVESVMRVYDPAMTLTMRATEAFNNAYGLGLKTVLKASAQS